MMGGKRPSLKELLMISETGLTNRSAFSLINHDGMPSGSVAFFALRENNFKKTLSVETTYGAVVMPCC